MACVRGWGTYSMYEGEGIRMGLRDIRMKLKVMCMRLRDIRMKLKGMCMRLGAMYMILRGMRMRLVGHAYDT